MDITTDLVSAWGQRAVGLAPSRPVARTFMALVRRVAADEDWTGACHMVSASLAVLLREQDVPAELCIGQASVSAGEAFDHSWIEISGAVYDIGIVRPNEADSARPPVLAGFDLGTGLPTTARYGIETGLPPDAVAEHLMRTGFKSYMNDAPIPMWQICSELAATLELPKAAATALAARHNGITWALRAPYY